MKAVIARALALLFLTATALHAQVPQLINYQGRVAVGGVNFDGAGQFKFALVDAGGATSYWSNDGTSTAGSEPAAAVTLTVTNGQYSVLLGDTTLPNMTAIPASAFNNSGVFLRVWFNDGANGSQLLTPDQRLRMDCATTTGDAWLRRDNGTPPDARFYHTAVWTGSEMIVWGGDSFGGTFLNTGGRYNPAGNSWTAVSTTGAPAARNAHTAVWTGSEMIVWGGQNGVNTMNTGGRYNPAANRWTDVSTSGAPSARYGHTAVWTGSEMIVWGGEDFGPVNFNDGARYHPVADSWMTVSTTVAPSARATHTAVWTGSEMIIWGGYNSGDGSYSNDGGRFNPAGDSWRAVSSNDAPAGRFWHTAVWTGSEMIVWGGQGASLPMDLNDGGRYHPVANSWTAVADTGAPAGRYGHTAVWTGSEMIVWGGKTSDGVISYNDGGRYTPEENSWTAVTGAPTAGEGHTAVWTGSEMIVWGGWDGISYLNNGGRYHPVANRWTAVTTTGAPDARAWHTAVWTGSEMIVWGGHDGSSKFNDTFSYTPDCGAFRITSAILEAGNLILSFPTVMGRAYTLWRSDTLTSGTWTNAGLPALAGTGAALTFTIPAPAAGVLKRFFRVQADP